MVNPHPHENDRNGHTTLLAYFAARCPMPYPAKSITDERFNLTPTESDCLARIEWARTMLHQLWPVPAQNSKSGAP